MPRYRVIDSAGSERGFVDDERAIEMGDRVSIPDEEGTAEVIEIYDDEYGREGGVEATLVLDIE